MYENRIFPVIRPDFVTEVLPNHFVSDYPNLVIFLQYYYDSLDSDGEFSDIVKDLYHISNIGITELKYLDNLFYELGLNVSKEIFKNPREVLRSFADFFRTKGSEQSLKQFFRMFYDANAKITYPKDEIFMLNDPESRLGVDSLKKIQDGKLYQVLSLFIKSPIGYKEYEELYKKFVHPAGFYVGALAEIHTVSRLKPSGFQDSNIVDDSLKISDEKILSPEITVIPILKSDIGYSDIMVFDGETVQGAPGATFSHEFDNVSHYTDENWFLISEDVEGLVAQSPTLEEIFASWYRFSHDTSGVYPASQAEADGWDYDPLTEAIICQTNTATYVGFISEYSGLAYDIKATLSSTQADDDAITIILAYVEQDNREYTLSAVRSMGGFAPTNGFGVYYNYGQTDQRLISSVTVSTNANGGGGTGWSGHGPSRIEANKTGGIITVSTSQNGSTIIDPSTLITVDLLSDPDLLKFSGSTRNGYGARSQGAASFTDIENSLVISFGGSGYGSPLETAGHNVRSALDEGIHNPAFINIAALDPYKTVETEDTLYPPLLSSFAGTVGYSIYEAPPNKVGIIQVNNLASQSVSSTTIDLKALWGYNSDKILRKDSQKFLTRVFIRGDFQGSNDVRIYGLDSDTNHAFVVGDGDFDNVYSTFTMDTSFPVVRIDNFIKEDGTLDLQLHNTGTDPSTDLILVFSYKYNTIYDWIKFDSTAVFDINSFNYADNRNIRDVGIQEIKNRNIMYLKDTII